MVGSWPNSHNTFANLTFPFSVPFSSAPPIPNWLWVCTVSSAIFHIVKQFVKLFVIQYGLTFCLSMHILYEAQLHSLSRLIIKQLNLMSTHMSLQFNNSGLRVKHTVHFVLQQAPGVQTQNHITVGNAMLTKMAFLAGYKTWTSTI